MLLALAEHDIVPDVLVGASVGAVNAAWVAGYPGLDGARRLADLWRGITRKDVFPLAPWVAVLALLGRGDHLVTPGNLIRLLSDHLPYERLEQSAIPLHVVATDIRTGMETVLVRGRAVEAVLASAAIPGVFPPVRVGDEYLVDGGVADNTPISTAVKAGAARIYVLPTGYACALPRPPRGAFGMALQAITLLLQQRLHKDVERYQPWTDLRVVPPLCPLDVSPLDFSHTGQLIDRSHALTQRWLAGEERDMNPALLLSLHRH
jgi:NTE family protein